MLVTDISKVKRLYIILHIVSDEYSNTVEAEILCQMKRTNTEETDCFLYIQSELNTLETKIYTIKPSRTNIMIGGIKIEHSVGIRNKYLSLEV